MAVLDPTSRWRRILEPASTVLLIVASIAVVAAVVLDRRDPPLQRGPRRVEPALPAEPVSIEGAVLRGSDKARVVLIEYSDFECPYCAKYARETHPEISRQYVDSGKVLLAFRHLPLSTHANSQKAAEAAECAGLQGRFWQMHDLLFRNVEELGDAYWRRYAGALALDLEKFDGCLAGDMSAKVRADVETAKTVGVSGTPTFLLGTRLEDGTVRITQRLRGAQSVKSFQAAFDALLSSELIAK